MNTNPNPTSTPTAPGWTCPSCQQWVPSNAQHTCPSYQVQPNPPAVRYDATFQWLALAERAVKALERIAERLDRAD